MANRIHITNPSQLSKQEEGIFSVDGRKMKLFSRGHHQALFAVFSDGRYKYRYDKNDPKNTFGVVAVDLKDIDDNSTIYKIGDLKS